MKKLFLMLMMSCATLFLSGCNNDSSNDSLIVGTWYSYTNGGTTKCFHKNGSWSSEDMYGSMYGSYSYDSKSRVLIIDVTPSAYNNGGMSTYYVLSLTSTTLSYTDGGGVINNFKRIN